MSKVYVGQTIGITATFKDADDALYTPTTVTAVALDPAGVETSITASIVNVSTGVYRATIDTDTAGRWRLEIYGDDTYDAVAHVDWTVYEGFAHDGVT